MLELTSAGYTIALVSAGMTLLSTLVRNAVLDKGKLREQKEKLKHHQAQIKEAQKKKDMKGMQHHQQQMMEVSMEQMRSGMKPMLFTLIPFILVFQWMGGAYGDIGSLHNVTITALVPEGIMLAGLSATGDHVVDGGAVTWNFTKLESQYAGEVNMTVESDSPPQGGLAPRVTVGYTTHEMNAESYEAGAKAGFLDATAAPATVEGNKAVYIITYSNTASYKVASLLGWDLGWFGWYFIASFASSMIFNKLLGNT